MHSSRMRTVHSLTVSHSIPCILEGGGLPNPPTPEADLFPREADPPPPGCRDIPPPGCRAFLPNACWEATPFPMHAGKPLPPAPPPWTEGMTHACKILPCPKLRLRAVMNAGGILINKTGSFYLVFVSGITTHSCIKSYEHLS